MSPPQPTLTDWVKPTWQQESQISYCSGQIPSVLFMVEFCLSKIRETLPLFVLLVIIKHAVVAFISSKREGTPHEIVNHSLIVP